MPKHHKHHTAEEAQQSLPFSVRVIFVLVIISNVLATVYILKIA